MAESRATDHRRGAAAAVERFVRGLPIRWRIIAIAVLNSALAVVLLSVIWNGAQVMGDAWADLRRVRQSERFLDSLGRDAERLQTLTHRYFAASEPAILERVVDLRDTLMSRLRVQALLDPLIAGPTRGLTEITERLVAGFEDLRETRAGTQLSYETKIVRPSREMAALYARLAPLARAPGRPPALFEQLAQSREAYASMMLATNGFSLSGAHSSAREAKAHAAEIVRMAAAATDGLEDERLRAGFEELSSQAETIEEGVDELGIWFATQNRLLRESVDGNARAMSEAIDGMRASIGALETSAQARFDRTFEDAAVKLAVLSVAFVTFVVLIGVGIAKSISDPLGDLRADMVAVMGGRLDRRIGGLVARDEIGQMARAVEVFRGDAIARRRAEEDLRTAKEKAEATLEEIRAMQASLIEAEKLAALGGLVAGVAHEVNNPVGISLTVASSLALRSESFAAEVASGQIRRSRLAEFVGATQLAADQLVANLKRAGDLVQSFKQVAVDRSQVERRSFDLAQATEQILASLKPSLKSSRVRAAVEIPPGLTLDSFPGPYGQIVTNLFLNAVHHAFGPDEPGTITISGRASAPGQVQIVFRDDGRGMAEDVQRRAFDPFFTTRRGEGGTGLGLHIVYNLVTGRLGGRIILSSAPGSGSTFLIVLPQHAPDEPVERAAGAPSRETVHAGS